MPIITIASTGKRFQKWMFLVHKFGYVGCCKKGCHGEEASTFNGALAAMRNAQRQCTEEAYEEQFDED